MTLDILPITAAHSAQLSELVLGDRPAYRQYFTPFSFETQALITRLQAAQRDRYWSIQIQGDWAGFFHAARL